jgi:chromate transport protein ChrA
MESLIHADIFFFIASTGFILVTIVLIVVLYYIFKLVKAVNKIVKIVHEESIVVIDDINEVRGKIKEKAQTLNMLLGAIASGGALKKILSSLKKKK